MGRTRNAHSAPARDPSSEHSPHGNEAGLESRLAAKIGGPTSKVAPGSGDSASKESDTKKKEAGDKIACPTQLIVARALTGAPQGLDWADY